MPKTIYDAKYRDLIGILRSARQANGLRQKDVARKLGIGRTWVSKIEQSEIRLDVMQLVCLAKLYKLDVHDLVDALDHPQGDAEGTRQSTSQTSKPQTAEFDTKNAE